MRYWSPFWGHWPGCGCTAGRRCLPIVPWSWLFPGTVRPDRVLWQTLTVWIGFPPLCVIIQVSLQNMKVCLPLMNLVVICEVIVIFWSSTQTVFTGVSRVVPEYESSQMMISAHMHTGQRAVAVRHCVALAFLTPFSVCRMSVRPYQIDGGSHCSGKVLCVFCKNVYPLSEGCVSWLCRTGFVTLRRRMMTKGLSSSLVVSLPVIRLWFMNVWGMWTTYILCQTDWSQWLWWCCWKCQYFLLAMISRWKCSWAAVWCGTMPLSENYLLYLFKWYRLIIVSGQWKASLWAIDGSPHLMHSDIYW